MRPAYSWLTRRGEGGQKWENLAYVIYKRSLGRRKNRYFGAFFRGFPKFWRQSEHGNSEKNRLRRACNLAKNNNTRNDHHLPKISHYGQSQLIKTVHFFFALRMIYGIKHVECRILNSDQTMHYNSIFRSPISVIEMNFWRSEVCNCTARLKGKDRGESNLG